MTTPTDARPDPVQEWQQLYLGAPNAAPSVAACVAAAFRLADQVWRQVAADPILDVATRTAVSGQDSWARTALAAYQHLADTHAYGHLDLPTPLRCWADPTRLRTWLTAPSPLPGFADTTVAETWAITDDGFQWEADGIGAAMATLIEQAQHAGVFGVPGYTISLRHVTTDDPDADATIEHQVTLRNPSGVVLAAAPDATDHLVDDDRSGVDAALALFANTSAVVNELLAAEAHLITSAIHPGPGHPLVRGPARPNRGFAPLDLTVPAAGLAAIEASPTGPDRHLRR